jgi:hypothetical protein
MTVGEILSVYQLKLPVGESTCVLFLYTQCHLSAPRSAHPCICMLLSKRYLLVWVGSIFSDTAYSMVHAT